MARPVRKFERFRALKWTVVDAATGMRGDAPAFNHQASAEEWLSVLVESFGVDPGDFEVKQIWSA